MSQISLSRRDFSGLLFGGLVISSLPAPLLASVNEASTRSLSFKSLHTGEEGSFIYARAGEYDAAGLAAINKLLRDHRTGDVTNIDVALLDQLYLLNQSVGGDKCFNVISGYRSPKTNAMLRSKSNGGVAKKSYHMRGMAIDISIPETDLRELHKIALNMKAGGVGLYAKSGFMHVDSGPVRSW